MPLSFYTLAKVFQQLEAVSSGNSMREILADFFKHCPKAEISIACYLTTGRISSEFEDINTGMADRMVLRAIASAFERRDDAVAAAFKKSGDIGLAAEKYAVGRGSKLTVAGVFRQLHAIANASGSGSQEKKISLFAQFLKQSSPLEARYLARIVLGTLRLGAADKTLLDSLSIAFTGSKEAKKKLEHAYNICPDVGFIAKTFAAGGVKAIEKVGVLVGRPIQMMLCQRIKAVPEIFEHMQAPIAVEMKYDGERVQAHKHGSKIVLFSRRLENITAQFPELVENLSKALRAKTCVVEGEIVPVDAKGNILPFQVLMQRRRKYDIEEYVRKIPVNLHLFELLYLNGKSHINTPYTERHKMLERIVKQNSKIKMAVRQLCNDEECIEDFFDMAIQTTGEGIVVKSTSKDSVYKPGARGWLWIKWKREYSKGIQDTFDLVAVGAFAGKGRRSGSYGALLCATYNDRKDCFETVSKLGSGFTDSHLAELPKKFRPLQLSHRHARVVAGKNLKPDFWFEPKIVVEVIAGEITKSPIHTAAQDHGQGLALRFPRFVKYRPEKKAEQATTSEEIMQMMRKRQKR